MKTLLIFPPAADPAHPPLGVAALAGFLRSAGEEVDLADLNLLSYEYLLSPRHIAVCTQKIEQRIHELESLPELDKEAVVEYRLLVTNVMAAQYLCTALSVAMDDMRSPRIYKDRDRYLESALIIKRGMELVSAAYYPVRWYARGFSMGHRPTSSSEVLDAIEDYRQNLFLSFITDSLPGLTTSMPDVIGISLNYYCQLIPTLTIAKHLRKIVPNALIVIGGGLVCFYEQRWEVLKPFENLVDAWIPYEGEIPLRNLLVAMRAGKPISSVDGVLSFEIETTCMRPAPPPPDPSELPIPDFAGLPLDRYLSPELILPILSSRGCYWGRCAFCSHDRLYRGRFQKKSPAAVIEDLEELSSRYNCRNFYFTDEAIPPDTAKKVAGAVLQKRLSVKWFGEVRFEKTFDEETLAMLHKGGCCMLMFGMESSVQRVLNLMRKGTTPERIKAIIKACAQAGIRPFIMFFTGFPTETREEATETIRFIENLREYITHIAFTNFILEHHAPVYKNPLAFGISEVLAYEGEDLKIYSQYKVTIGMNTNEAVAFLEEIKEREHIAPLANFFALSRSHLFFLPPKNRVRPEKQPTVRRNSCEPAKIFPVRRPDLIPRTLAFDIDESADNSLRGSINYVYSPDRDRLVKVGEHGLALLGPCDGSSSLADILADVGPENRETVLSYYDNLSGRDLLSWEIRC